MKFIVIPHTHWDREWYFTNEVSDTLLKYNLDSFLNSSSELDSYYLDGQVSILEDYLNYANNENKIKLHNLIRSNNITVGPLYSQPDVFNSLGETTIRNALIAKDYLEQKNLPNCKNFYCPDTFGFGFNFPQIINYLGFDNFVFWRGLSNKWENSDFNLWTGIDGTSIKTYRFKYGYWKISSLFPWNSLNTENLQSKTKQFLDCFVNSEQYTHYTNQAKLTNGVVLIPFGGDQAPIHPLTNLFFNEVNKQSKDEWQIGKFDDFFDHNQEPIQTINGAIDYGYESKIHRTISSTRYDFKKLFRENEINLYHQLEPLEMIYKWIDKKYNIDNSNIIKKLTCMQAHDILGGCVADNAYMASLQKLINIYDSIQTKKEIIMKQISIEFNLNNNHLLIFNPNVSKENNNFELIKIYTPEKLEGYYFDEKIEVFIISSIPYKNVENSYESQILVINKNLATLSFFVFDLNKLKTKNFLCEDYSNANNFLNFKVSYDEGDLFDADPNYEKIAQTKLEIFSSKIHDFISAKLIQIEGNLTIDDIKNEFNLSIVNIKGVYYFSMNFNNQMENVIIDWIPPLKFEGQLSYLQHLGIGNYNFEKIDNWKELKYKEAAVNVQKNSGIIFDDKNFICTRGTNQFSFDNKEITINLYRSIGILGKRDLKVRPGCASGIDGHIIEAPLGQMKSKTLIFDFKFGVYKDDVSSQLNSFYRKPIIRHSQSMNLIDSFLEKFIFIKKNLNIKTIKINLPNHFISSSYYKNDKMNFRTVNFDKNGSDFNKIITKEKNYFE